MVGWFWSRKAVVLAHPWHRCHPLPEETVAQICPPLPAAVSLPSLTSSPSPCRASPSAPSCASPSAPSCASPSAPPRASLTTPSFASPSTSTRASPSALLRAVSLSNPHLSLSASNLSPPIPPMQLVDVAVPRSPADHVWRNETRASSSEAVLTSICPCTSTASSSVAAASVFSPPMPSATSAASSSPSVLRASDSLRATEATPSPEPSPGRSRLQSRSKSRRFRAPSLSLSPPSAATPIAADALDAVTPLPPSVERAVGASGLDTPTAVVYAAQQEPAPADCDVADVSTTSTTTDTASIPADATTLLPTRSLMPVVECVFRLSQRGFACSLCPPRVFMSWSALTTHRSSCHRHTQFVDKFVAACTCNRVFDDRMAAALHGRSCGPRRTPTPSRSPGTAIPRRRVSLFGGTKKPTVAPLFQASPPCSAPADTSGASDVYIADLNVSTLAVAPLLASRPAASGDGIPPPTCASVSAASSAVSAQPMASLPPSADANLPVPPLSPSRQPLLCPSCRRRFPSKRSLAQHCRSCPMAVAPSTPSPLVALTVPDHHPPAAAASRSQPSYILRTDGGCRGNGLSSTADAAGGAGSVLLSPGGSIIWSFYHWLPDGASNNVAEYRALLNGLLGVLHWSLPSLQVECDSHLVLSQVSGNARVSHRPLRVLRTRVLKALQLLRAKGTAVQLRHIPRNENAIADSLANKAMDLRETMFECHCSAPSLNCIPKDLQLLFVGSASWPPLPSLVWNIDSSCFVSRAAPRTPPSSPATLRSLARARLRSPLMPPPVATGQIQLSAPARPTTSPALPPSLPIEASPPLPALSPDQPRVSPPAPTDFSLCCGEVQPNSPTPVSDAPVDSGNLAAATAMLDAILVAPTSQPLPQEPLPDAVVTSPPTLRQPRLVLPAELPPDATESLERSLKQLVSTMVLAIDDADSWGAASTIIDSFPFRLHHTIRQYVDVPATYHRQPSSSHTSSTVYRPSTVPTFQVDHRIAEAHASLSALQQSHQASTRSIYRARRKLGRLQKARLRIQLRRSFGTNEKRCVEAIFRRSHVPFRAVNRPPTSFDSTRASGRHFLDLLGALPPATYSVNTLTDDISVDEIEDALNAANLASAPGLDGIPYRIYFRFRLTLLPLLHTIFSRCWAAKRIPGSWKTSVTELIYKKGDPADMSNWRPLALQSTLYKLYASILKTRFSQWLEANNRLSNSQKGFRTFNGCHEHNFLAQALLDTTRRSKSPFFAVWYDL
ncbi:hypothetical protein Ae201684P_019259 [Aphanomyces euteiches]|nr:hypothetical protein Ae201684P_019259 [Aphanomyces euteiches]